MPEIEPTADVPPLRGSTAKTALEVRVPTAVLVIAVPRKDTRKYLRVQVDLQYREPHPGVLFSTRAAARRARADATFCLPYESKAFEFVGDDGDPLFLRVTPWPEIAAMETVLVSSTTTVDAFQVAYRQGTNAIERGWVAVSVQAQPPQRSLDVALYRTAAEAFADRQHRLTVGSTPGTYQAVALSVSRDHTVVFRVEVAEPAVEDESSAGKSQTARTPPQLILGVVDPASHGHVTLIPDTTECDVDIRELDEDSRRLLYSAVRHLEDTDEAIRSAPAPPRRRSARERLGVHVVSAARPTDPDARR